MFKTQPQHDFIYKSSDYLNGLFENCSSMKDLKRNIGRRRRKDRNGPPLHGVDAPVDWQTIYQIPNTALKCVGMEVRQWQLVRLFL